MIRFVVCGALALGLACTPVPLVMTLGLVVLSARDARRGLL